jgi:hypothetical protein
MSVICTDTNIVSSEYFRVFSDDMFIAREKFANDEISAPQYEQRKRQLLDSNRTRLQSDLDRFVITQAVWCDPSRRTPLIVLLDLQLPQV